MFTNKLLVKGQNKKKNLQALKSFSYFIFVKEITAKTVDEDPVAFQSWISRKEVYSAKILRTENEKSKGLFTRRWGTPGR